MRFFLWISLAGLAVMTGMAVPVKSESPVSGTGMETIPSLVQSIRFSDDPVFCETRIPLEDPQVAADLEREMLLALWNRPQVILWIKRASQLFPLIEPILAEEGMPDDLKYVPVIESALRPHARSSANAVGYWQFLKATGERYGLRIDDHVDERRNIFKSTRAACRYLKDLLDEFGSFPLALAAYNMGEHGLSVEIDAQQTRNYFDLYLPLETQHYLHKLTAAKLILENPEKYGFHLEPGDLYPDLRLARLDLTPDEEVPLLIVAQAVGVTFKTLKTMNPDIRGYYLAPGPSTVLVPEGLEEGFHSRFADLYTQWRENSHTRIHVVRPGESLISIARAYDMPLAELLRRNRIPYNHVIHPGDRLTVR